MPDYALADAFDRLRGWFITPYIGEAKPDVEAEARKFRLHGRVTRGKVHTDLCG